MPNTRINGFKPGAFDRKKNHRDIKGSNGHARSMWPGLVRHARHLNVAIEEIAQQPNIEKIRVAGYSVFAYVVPRSEIKRLKNLQGNNHACLYFLFYDPKYDSFYKPSEPEDLDRPPIVYVGYGGQGAFPRLRKHNSKKTWWNVAVIVLAADDQQLRGGQVELLEASFLREAGAIGRYRLDNDNKMREIEKFGFDRACQMEFRNVVRNILRHLRYSPLLSVEESINEEMRQTASISGSHVTRPHILLTQKDNNLIRRSRLAISPRSSHTEMTTDE